MQILRPMPPATMVDELDARDLFAFRPAPDLADWLRTVFIDAAGQLHNPDHGHLEHATIGALWTNVLNTRSGRRIVGQAELGEPRGAMGKWAKGRVAQQVREWFGREPDFIVTFDALHAVECTDAEFCALVEHELYHCAQEHDEFGSPKFRLDGSPAFAMRGHDVEEFVGVVARYGAEASGVARLVEAAMRGPTVAPVRIAHACGTCQLRAA